jgi:cation transport regulator ChaB
MPYEISNPPDQIKALPKQGQEIWISAFNAAHAADPDEGKAAATAWAAVDGKYEKDAQGNWRAKADIAFCEMRSLLSKEIRAKYGEDAYISEAFVSPQYIVFTLPDGKYYRLSYGVVDNAVQLGENPVEVEKKWIEMRSQQTETGEELDILMRLGNALNPEGTEWDVTICKAGLSLAGVTDDKGDYYPWYITEDALRDADAPALFEKVDVNLYELPQQGAMHIPAPLYDLKPLLVKNKVGWIDSVRNVAGEGLKGILHFLESAKWIGKNLLSAMKEGTSVYGLSYDAKVRAAKDIVDGKQVVKIVKFTKADSVDIVTRPAAGGKFNRAVASVPAQKQEVNMDKKKIWDIINEKRPDLLVGKTFETTSDQEFEALARAAIAEKPQTDEKDEVNVLRCEMKLKDKLAASDLPDTAKSRISRSFGGVVFKDEDLDRAIADEKDYHAAILKSAQPQDSVPASRVTGGIDSFDKATMAIDRLFGLTKEDLIRMAGLRRLDGQQFFGDVRSTQAVEGFDQIPAFSSIREMYTFFTGDPDVTGRVNLKAIPKDIRSRMEILSNTFTYILGNTLGRSLVKQYLATDYGESLLISVRKPVKDYRLQEAVLVGGFADLDTVDPEAADYQEVSAVTDEESTYTIAIKGNILTISQKTIINDDISVITRLIQNLGRAARRTHAKYVWNFLINNSNCTDATALFTVGHGNLGAAALTITTALIAYAALAAMTEKDSAERLGLLDDQNVKPTLFYPVGLLAAADTVVNDDFYYTGAADLTTKTRNSLRGKINGKMVSLLADANDWYLMLPPDVVDIIEMGYLNGRQEPEMFLADSAQAEQVFVADKIRYKIRHQYAGAPIDYRSGYKAIV